MPEMEQKPSQSAHQFLNSPYPLHPQDQEGIDKAMVAMRREIPRKETRASIPLLPRPNGFQW